MTSNGWRLRGGRDAEADWVYNYPYYPPEEEEEVEEELSIETISVGLRRKVTKVLSPNYYSLSKNKTHCELCGNENVPTHLLEVDHFDRNHRNDSKDNIWVLCKACHRVKTFLENIGKSLEWWGLVDIIMYTPELKAKWRARSEEWLAQLQGKLSKTNTTSPEQLQML